MYVYLKYLMFSFQNAANGLKLGLKWIF